jgi:hypothetical protein
VADLIVVKIVLDGKGTDAAAEKIVRRIRSALDSGVGATLNHSRAIGSALDAEFQTMIG